MFTKNSSIRFALSILIALPALVASAARGVDRRGGSETIHYSSETAVLVGGAAAPGFKASAAGDTICLYGGPGSQLGKFQLANEVTPDPQGWSGLDVTDQPTHWQRHTFNSPTGTNAMWAGRTSAQEPGWAAAPGYGNNWNSALEYRRTVGDPSAGQTVGLEFLFNHDVEPGYDYFHVEYDSAGITLEIYNVTGYNAEDWQNPVYVPVNFPDDVVTTGSIQYAGDDYAGEFGDEIVIRLRVTSDGAWSNEDGLWPGAGAAQVDNIQVTSSEGVDYEDFEGAGPNYQWVPVKGIFAGDFAKVFARVSDLDPCRENVTPVLGFMDDGEGPYNPSYVGPGTGGTTSVNWSYGVANGWVVNYNGGVSFGLIDLQNYAVSPPIAWDLPGTADDDPLYVGSRLRFSAYEHLPLMNGIFRVWDVRSSSDGGATWTNWANRNFVYYSNTPRWNNQDLVVSDLLEPDRTHVQIRLGAYDAASLFAFPGTDATVSPNYDNVALLKYRIGGPSIVTRDIDIFQDSFSQSGLADASDQAARDLLDVRVDMARDVGTGNGTIHPGDSLIVDVESLLPGVSISDPSTQIRMHYSLNMNPAFEAAIRGNAPVTDAAAGLNGWDQSEGTVNAMQSTTSAGAVITNRFFVDLPDENFMYPGDILEYFVEAVDDDGNTSTLPAVLSGYDDPTTPYSRTWTVRALPTIQNSSGDQPEILVWNDFGHRGGENELYLAFDQNGMTQGVDYDVYTTMGPSSRVSNGLGSSGAHGATSSQLNGYRVLVYDGGDLPNTMEDNDAGSWTDKEDDVGVLIGWFSAANQDRAVAQFADNVATSLQFSTESLTYLQTVLGVVGNGPNVRPEIGNQTAPKALSTGAVPGLNSEFVAFGGCLGINTFDSITPAVGAVRSHAFEVAGAPGSTYSGIAAGVVWDRIAPDTSRKVSATFPFGFTYIQGDPTKVGESVRSILLGELLSLFGYSSGGPVTDAIPSQFLQLASPAPSPFNPRTKLSFVLGRDGVGSVSIYNVRGELVRTLARDAAFVAGRNELVWDGRDDRGVVAASGVYAVNYRIDGFAQAQKVVLLK